MPFALTLGGVTFLLAVIWGSPFVEMMRRFRLGKNVRVEGPASHQIKTGTPAMGGLLIIGWTLIISLLVNIVQLTARLRASSVPLEEVTGNLPAGLQISETILIPIFALVGFAIIGGVDDYQGFRTKPGVGMSARTKFWLQMVVSILCALAIWYVNGQQGFVGIPTVPEFFVFSGIAGSIVYIGLATFIINGTSNAMNLIDGLDGLAGMIAAMCYIAYGIIAFLQGQQFILTFCMIMVGAIFAFLWFNAHPAQMFMGDVGSQALGGVLAVIAFMTHQWLILPIIAFMPVITTISVMLQVASAVLSRKYLGRDIRPFKMSPLHNHFVITGWSETQIVQRWWLISLMTAMVGIALALI